MTYTDNYKFESSQMMSDDLSKLRVAAKPDRPRLFAEYCFKAIQAKEAGKMPLRDAAFSIARTMFLKELEEEPVIDRITGLAGELELPAEFVSGNTEEKWQELVELIDTYAKQHQAEGWLNQVESEQAEMERKTTEADKQYRDH